MGGEESSISEKIAMQLEKAKMTKERIEDSKCNLTNLTIRIYSDKKISQRYKDYLKSIIMKEWNIIYLDGGFTKEKTNVLIDNYIKK